jgi:DNA-binding transcriptional MerR regulator
MARGRAKPVKRSSATRARASTAYLSRTVLCRLGGISEEQLSVWEFEEFIAPATMLEIDGHREGVYDQAALRRIRTIRALAEDLGVNLPGIGVILELLDRMG